MGRSVSTPSNCEAVAHKDTLHFGHQYNEDTGEHDFDAGYCEMQGRDDLDDLKDSIIEQSKARWPSFATVGNKWLGNEDRVLLENDLAYIGISEYCGLTAIWLKSKHSELDGSYYSDEASRAPLCEGFTSRISGKFMEMFNEFNKLGSMCNGESVLQKVA